MSEVWNNIFHTEAPSRSASSRSWSWVLSLNGILLDASSILGFHWSNPSAKMDGWGNRGQSRKICKPCELENHFKKLDFVFFEESKKGIKGIFALSIKLLRWIKHRMQQRTWGTIFLPSAPTIPGDFPIFGSSDLKALCFFLFSAMLGRQVGDTTEGFKAAAMGIFYQKSLSNCSFWDQNVLERCHFLVCSHTHTI